VLLTLPAAARSLGLAPSTLRLQIKLGKLAASRLDGRWLIHVDELERYRRDSLRKPETA
jgi:hypothetical protein